MKAKKSLSLFWSSVLVLCLFSSCGKKAEDVHTNSDHKNDAQTRGSRSPTTEPYVPGNRHDGKTVIQRILCEMTDKVSFLFTNSAVTPDNRGMYLHWDIKAYNPLIVNFDKRNLWLLLEEEISDSNSLNRKGRLHFGRSDTLYRKNETMPLHVLPSVSSSVIDLAESLGMNLRQFGASSDRTFLLLAKGNGYVLRSAHDPKTDMGRLALSPQKYFNPRWDRARNLILWDYYHNGKFQQVITWLDDSLVIRQSKLLSTAVGKHALGATILQDGMVVWFDWREKNPQVRTAKLLDRSLGTVKSFRVDSTENFAPSLVFVSDGQLALAGKEAISLLQFSTSRGFTATAQLIRYPEVVKQELKRRFKLQLIAHSGQLFINTAEAIGESIPDVEGYRYLYRVDTNGLHRLTQMECLNPSMIDEVVE